MVSTRNGAGKGKRLGRRRPESLDDPALLRGVRAELRRVPALQAVDLARVLEILAPLYPRETYSPEGELLTWEDGALAWVAKRQIAEPIRREAWRRWQQRAKRIDAAQNRLIGLLGGMGLGGPRPCPECRAVTPGERTVWCVAACPPERASGKTRLERIRAELKAARAIKPGAKLTPAVPPRGPESALAWVGPIALAIKAYLVQIAAGACPITVIERAVASILRLASSQRITRDMVSDRTRRAATPRLK